MVLANRQRSLRSRGFTLVELLVVITIIGILMGLLIPAVNAARETARRNQCSTQINNLAKATIQYEMAKKHYPGWLQSFSSFAGTIDPSDPENTTLAFGPHEKVGGWAVTLLPYLDAQPTYEIWTENKYPVISDSGYTVNAAPNLAIMQCPSSTTMEGNAGRNSYISNNGMHPPAEGISFARSMSRANGVFNNKFPGPGGSAPAPVGDRVTADDLKDGLGNTVLFSENLQAMPWHLVSTSAGDSATALAGGVYRMRSRYAQGFVWHFEDPNQFGDAPAVSPVHLINGQFNGEDKFLTRMDGNNAHHVARPSSAHNSGVNMGFADGGSRFVQDTIDYRVYQALMTPRGKSSDVPFREYVLQGEEL